MTDKERSKKLNDCPVRDDGDYVLYWMQQSQRASGNPALDVAVRKANELGKPLIACFGIDTSYPDANLRHFAFLLQGLAELSAELAERRIKLIASIKAPVELAAELAGDAALLVCDTGYLRHQREWRRSLAERVDCRVLRVEGDVVVPVELVSDRREWAARTIRDKLEACRDDFVGRRRDPVPDLSSLPLELRSDVDVADWQQVASRLDVDDSVAPVQRFRGGTAAARKRLTAFLRNGLAGYADSRNDPARPRASELSPHLHFGQISPVEVAFKVQRTTAPSEDDKQAFLEELIVRRELAVNFVHYAPDYDSYDSLPDWARQTLDEHAGDPRPATYERAELEACGTHDEHWNAAMREMRHTGYMHNYMRMYWGKKILEWSESPRQAYRTVLELNNKYFLDGRDPNSYANVGWIFGLHDRAWAEREVYGKVRYMSAGGLERKFDTAGYRRRVDALVAAEEDGRNAA